MFLCISRMLYCEIVSGESIMLFGIIIFITWLWLRSLYPLLWWPIGCASINFWDLTLGMLLITSGYKLIQKILKKICDLCKSFVEKLQPLYMCIRINLKDIWQDKIFRYTLSLLIIFYIVIMIRL